ncbi:MAG: hypothetical protein ACQESN_04020 [Thermotogota bacterium]
MKLIINLVSFLIISIFSFLTLKYLNEILLFLNEKQNNIENTTKIIEENERIQALDLDSFLNEDLNKKAYRTDTATIFIYNIKEYDFVYIEED